METKSISFVQLFSDKHIPDLPDIDRIEIPIIQRDYAQGRTTKEISRIRANFLNVLFNAITGISEPVKLDFIYGDITKGQLVPLDGQQRLTTLFLLHWYIAKHEKIDPEAIGFLQNFTYKTRYSSRDFCQKLAKFSPDYALTKISECIVDQSWFMSVWRNDPTIQSMLVMLDEIHKIFKDINSVWSILTDSENPAVSFYFLALKDLGISDTLYIKMNSRGKLLTEFEHFKANFEKIIKAVSEPLYSEFIKKVDKEWLDMFWPARGSDNIIDDEFMRYYRFITEMICYRDEVPIADDNFELSDEVYGPSNPAATKNLSFLFKALDCWIPGDKINEFFKKYFSFEYEKDKVAIFTGNRNLFLQCCNDYGDLIGSRNRKFSLNNTLLLYAVIIYLVNRHDITETQFIERIRIVRNLVLNSVDEIRETRMKELLNETSAIILNGEIKDSQAGQGYSTYQKNQEQQKIAWRQKNPQLATSLNQFEDHFLLQGSTAIIDLDDTAHFAPRVQKFLHLFNHKAPYALISNALLTKGDYSQQLSWRFLFGNDNDSTWRDLLTYSKSRKNFEDTRNVLSRLLDSITGDDLPAFLKSEVVNYLENQTVPKDWRFYFLKYAGMRSGRSGVFYWKNGTKDYEIIMMNTPLSLSGKHWDPFLYILYHDPVLHSHLTLEEYGSPLILNKTWQKLFCKNQCWLIKNNDGSEEKFDIPSQLKIDTVDRLDLIRQILIKRLIQP